MPNLERRYRETDSDFARDTTLTRPATLGRTTAPFYSGPIWRWDTVNALQIRLNAGTLASKDDLAVLGGANALAVQNQDGAWEIVQFATATLTAPNEYTLTRLLRGQQGSEGAMRSPLAAGARVVLLDDTLQQLSLGEAQARLPFHYRWGPSGKPLSDPSWQDATLQFQATGLIPFAPYRVRGAWTAAGDLMITWRRRDRSPAASAWDRVAGPLSETTEAYDLEITDGAGTVKRTFAAVAAPQQLYTAAQQAADFPSGLPNPLPNPLIVNLYQLSSVLGRGRRKTESLYVR